MLPLCPAPWGRQEWGLALGELTCRLGKRNLETHLSLQSQVQRKGAGKGRGRMSVLGAVLLLTAGTQPALGHSSAQCHHGHTAQPC